MELGYRWGALRVCFHVPGLCGYFIHDQCLFSCRAELTRRYSGGPGRVWGESCGTSLSSQQNLSSETMKQGGINWLQGCVSCCFSSFVSFKHGTNLTESPCYPLNPISSEVKRKSSGASPLTHFFLPAVLTERARMGFCCFL